MRRALVFGLVTLTGIFIVWFTRESGETSRDKFLAENKNASLQRIDSALKAIGHVAKKPGIASTEKVSSATKEKLSFAYRFLSEARHSLHRDEEREAILSKLSADPDAVALASSYLLSPDLVRAHFAEKQAEARLFSIGLLRQKAKQGDVDPLENTTRRLAAELTGRDSGVANPGRERDLEDLIASYFFVQKEGALKDLDKLVAKLGYSEAVKKAFVAGIYIALQNEYAKDAIVQRLEEVGISVRKETAG